MSTNLIDRIRNIFTDELFTREQLQAERATGQNDIVAEMVAQLEAARSAIRQHWIQESQERGVAPQELLNEFAGRIDDHNRMVFSLYEIGQNSADSLPEVIHPDGLLAAVEVAVRQQHFDFSPQETVAPELVQGARFERTNNVEMRHENAIEMAI
jgi:hypothetical protein